MFKKKKVVTAEEERKIYLKNFMDMISPSTIRFYPSYYIFGNTYRRVVAVRNFPMETKSMALLQRFGEKSNITLKLICNKMSVQQYENLVEGSVNKNVSDTAEAQFIKRTKANQNLTMAEKLVEHLNANPDERMFEVSVFIEVIGNSMEEMNELSNSVTSRLSGMTFDNLFMRQKYGFMAVNPCSNSSFNKEFKSQFTRHMPSSSVANLFPLSYSGVIEGNGFSLGKAKNGGNIIVDFDKRDKTHTNSNILILGNSGEGKSYTLKLIKTNWRLKGKKVICLDAEHEYIDLTRNLKGTFIDLMDGQYVINVLEPKLFADDTSNDSEDPEDFIETFHEKTMLSQHISFLRDFFRTYKNFNDEILDVLEIELERTYAKFKITYETDLTGRKPHQYPILGDLYNTVEMDYINYDKLVNPIFTKNMLQKLLLGLHSICKGSDSRFFNKHTNIPNFDYVTFGVKSLLEASTNLKNAMLFNILTYMTSKLLVEGDTIGILDEFYLFLDNIVMVKYVRNYMKRVRKKDSAIIIASQNIEDYLIKDIAELTKPLFSIPTYKFLFYPGTIDKSEYMKLLNINESEYSLIRLPERGNCLFCSGVNKYNLQVKAPSYKEELFGKSGGR